MKHFKSDQNHLLVLKRGEDLITQLTQFANDQNLSSAWLSGLGGAEGLTLGFYDLSLRDYKWQNFDNQLEIVSLTGNLSIVQNEPFWHIHGVFSDSNYQSFAGHVKSMTVGLTGEILITPLNINLTRLDDDETGLKLLSES